MNYIRQTVRTLLLSFLLTTFCTISLSAKDYTPARVTGLKAKAYESAVTLTWEKAAQATGYQVYMKTDKDGTYKHIVTVNATSYTKKNLKNGQTYYFRLRSICSTGKEKFYSKSFSASVKARPMVKVPPAPANFRVYQSGNGKAWFAWDRKDSSLVTGYAIFRYDEKTKKYKMVAKFPKASTVNGSVSGLTNGKPHKFRLKTYRTVNGVHRFSQWSANTISVRPQKLSEEVAAVHPIWYNAVLTRTVTASPASSGSKRQTVKKGTKVVIVSYGAVCKVKLPNSQYVYVKLSNLNLVSTIYTNTGYSRSVKQDFVNQNGYASPTEYLIWVSTYTQEYSLYTGSRRRWKLLRTAKIATGKETNPTSAQICRITRKEEAWYYDNDMYQAPIVYFKYENAFHSRLHYSDGSIADPTIGKPVSSGCIRMYDEDIQYIYDNCPIGTTVVIH